MCPLLLYARHWAGMGCDSTSSIMNHMCPMLLKRVKGQAWVVVVLQVCQHLSHMCPMQLNARQGAGLLPCVFCVARCCFSAPGWAGSCKLGMDMDSHVPAGRRHVAADDRMPGGGLSGHARQLHEVLTLRCAMSRLSTYGNVIIKRGRSLIIYPQMRRIEHLVCNCQSQQMAGASYIATFCIRSLASLPLRYVGT